MTEVVVELTVALTLLNLVVAAILAARRLVVARRNRRLQAAEQLLRPIVLAIIDGEEVELPDLDETTVVALAGLLRRFSKLLSGAARRHITEAALDSGLVQREVDALEDRRRWRRATAAMVLGDLGDRRYSGHLIRALDDPSQEVRNTAARSLGRMGAVEGIPRIARQMAMKRLPRALAAETLITMGPEASRWLVRLLEAPESEVRAAATELIGLVGSGSHASSLAGLLGDPDPEVRVKATRSLGRLGAEPAVIELRKILYDPLPFVRAAAARTLASIGDRDSIPRLLEMAVNDDYDAAKAAAQALAELDLTLVKREVRGKTEPPPHLAEALDLAEMR